MMAPQPQSTVVVMGGGNQPNVKYCGIVTHIISWFFPCICCCPIDEHRADEEVYIGIKTIICCLLLCVRTPPFWRKYKMHGRSRPLTERVCCLQRPVGALLPDRRAGAAAGAAAGHRRRRRGAAAAGHDAVAALQCGDFFCAEVSATFCNASSAVWQRKERVALIVCFGCLL